MPLRPPPCTCNVVVPPVAPEKITPSGKRTLICIGAPLRWGVPSGVQVVSPSRATEDPTITTLLPGTADDVAVIRSPPLPSDGKARLHVALSKSTWAFGVLSAKRTDPCALIVATEVGAALPVFAGAPVEEFRAHDARIIVMRVDVTCRAVRCMPDRKQRRGSNSRRCFARPAAFWKRATVRADDRLRVLCSRSLPARKIR